MSAPALCLRAWHELVLPGAGPAAEGWSVSSAIVCPMGELVERVDEHDEVLAVVERAEAIRRGWLHRVATIVCRDGEGRFLVHRRPEGVALFPGQINWMLGGAVTVAESYEEAAARELVEEVGVHACPRFLFKFCAGV